MVNHPDNLANMVLSGKAAVGAGSEIFFFKNNANPSPITAILIHIYKSNANKTAWRACPFFCGERVVMSEPTFPFETVWI